jgi:hypothetical protein
MLHEKRRPLITDCDIEWLAQGMGIGSPGDQVVCIKHIESALSSVEAPTECYVTDPSPFKALIFKDQELLKRFAAIDPLNQGRLIRRLKQVFVSDKPDVIHLLVNWSAAKKRTIIIERWDNSTGISGEILTLRLS